MGRTRSPSEPRVEGDEHTSPDDAEIAKLPSLEERRFGTHVRRLRRARGMTQERLAERCGLSADTIRRLEHGAFSPSLDTLTKLCAGLRILRSTLFESFELGENDQTREIVDLLLTRTPREIDLVLSVVRNLLDNIGDLTSLPRHDDPIDDEPAA
jgi:transcriptional regulator with XRE-family HTH domain